MNYISVERKQRVISLGNENNPSKLIACHGYGELIPYFSKKFDGLKDKIHIVIPEAPNRFYLKGFSGRVGASWMTSDERTSDIENNSNYLQTVFNHYHFNPNNFDAFGFSQGTETLTRWLAKEQLAPKKLILWGNGLPPDLPTTIKQLWTNTEIYFVVGNNDSFITRERLQEKISIFNKHDLSFEMVNYKGEHKIYPDVLNNLF